jgi:O-methyltransferase involved in polyketide biosynthesis
VKEAEPSRTAAGVAIRRAAHQLLDQPPVFPDPLALQVVSARVRRALAANPRAFERTRFDARLRAFLAVVWATLQWAAGLVGDTGGIVFDYGRPPGRWNLMEQLAFHAFAARLRSIGEPIRTRLRPDDVARRLGELGFAHVEDLDATALNRRYFAGRADGFRVSGIGHVVVARGRRFAAC